MNSSDVERAINELQRERWQYAKTLDVCVDCLLKGAAESHREWNRTKEGEES